MKKSKLFVALLAMLLALSCVLVACVGDEPEPTKYTVTFNLNGAPGNAPAAQTIEQGKTATAPTDPSWDDKHTFGGWCTDAAGNNAWSFTTAVTKDITLYAKWTEEDPGQITPTPVTYTVTFNLNGAPGTAPQAQKIVEGETATQPPVPTWDDEHEFGGWFTEAACTNEWSFTTAVTADTTLYAKWTEVEDLTPVVVTYTVTFNLNGAEGT
ncbi:MAG: InlB B-repeat-containing protein, partial [Clostridiales bacterium]|nr:InlB B-repeat-containing protein [Clostridiales bacterium]